MPQRTNDFQEVVTAIHRYFAPANATITPSALVKDQTGAQREVDILVEFQSGLYSIMVAVEAKDHARNLDLIDIEQYIGKYNAIGGIMVNQVIIVGRGFTENAKKKARTLGFQFETLQTLNTMPPSYFSPPPPHCDMASKPGTLSQQEAISRWALYDSNARLIPEKESVEGTIVQATTGIVCATPRQWAERVRPQFLCDLRKARSDRSDPMLVGVLNVDLSGHLLKCGDRTMPLGKLQLESRATIPLPRMTTKSYKHVKNENESHEVIVETGTNEFGCFEISYELDPDTKSPKSVHLDIKDDAGNPRKDYVATWNI